MLLLIFISYLIFSLSLVSSPLSGALILVIISVSLSLLISNLISKWMSFLIILLFLGGMMVLFVYICSLISSMKIFMKNLYLKSMLILSGFLLFSLVLMNYLHDYSMHFYMFNLSPMYMKSSLSILLSVASYLILVLVVSVKLCQKFKGGLKSKFYDAS